MIRFQFRESTFIGLQGKYLNRRTDLDGGDFREGVLVGK